MALEPGGAEQDTLALRLAASAARLPPHRPADDPTLVVRPAPPAPDRAEVDRLAAAMADRVGPAVHPYEVAALLESEGLTADAVRHRYGHPNLFSLASALYERVPRVHPEPPPAPDPWRPDTVRCLLRGALFALPGLAHLLAAPLWQAARHAPALVASAVVSWAWGQALGHRAHLRLATGRREAGRTLLGGGALGAALATATAAVVTGDGAAVPIAAGQSLYLAAAGVLLVLARELLLLAALTPLVAAAAVLPWAEPGPVPRAAAPLLALAATLAATGWALREARGAPPATGGARPPRLSASLPYGLFGLAAAVLVLLEGLRHPYAVIALTVSMGPAEWLLYRYRGWSVAALRTTATPAAFLLRSAGLLALCLAAYLLPLTPAALLTGSDPAALLLLAATLWTALLLQAFGVAWPSALICLAAAGCAAVVTLLRLPPGQAALPVCCGAAALCLSVCALRLLGRPSVHA